MSSNFNPAVDLRLNELAEEIYEINVANGWFTEERSFGDDIALLHSEVSEAYEEYRKGSPISYCYSERITLDGQTKPLGIPSELADIIVRVLDTAKRYDIDMDKIMAEKLAYNRTRGFRHGGKIV